MCPLAPGYTDSRMVYPSRIILITISAHLTDLSIGSSLNVQRTWERLGALMDDVRVGTSGQEKLRLTSPIHILKISRYSSCNPLMESGGGTGPMMPGNQLQRSLVPIPAAYMLRDGGRLLDSPWRPLI